MSIARFTLCSALLLGLAACGGSARVDGEDPMGAAGSGSASGASTGGAPSKPGRPGSGGRPDQPGSGGTPGVAGAPGFTGCVLGDKTYEVGEKWQCDCNTCWCEAGGQVYGTLKACDVCVDETGVHFVGESFPAKDGCNTCRCEVGAVGAVVSCTEKACVCDIGGEWWRNYVATDVSSCALLDYVCPANTQHFGNDCGCGCEQDKTCPEYVNCQPGANPNCQAQLAKCPYSKVAR